MGTSNLRDAFENFCSMYDSNKKLQSNVTTSLFRYTLPELGFKISERSQKRLHPLDREIALEFISKITCNSETASRLIDAQEKMLSKIGSNSTHKRQQRKNLKKFVDFLKKNNFSSPLPKLSKKPRKLKQIVEDRSHIEVSKKKRSLKPQIILSLDPNFYPGSLTSNKIYLDRIAQEIKKYSIFLSKNRREITKNIDIKTAKRLLGWMYIKGTKLKDLSFENLIKVYDFNLDICEFNGNINNYYIEKGKITSLAKKDCQRVINFLDEFLIEYKVNKKGTKESYVDAMINIAKFLYKDITDIDDAENYEDIPIVRRLRIYRNNLESDNIFINSPLINWETVIKCLEELKNRADRTHSECFRKDGKGFNPKKRSPHAIASSLQDFLMLGFFVLIPPSRNRVIRELRVGETLKHGIFKDGIFIPRNKMDNPEKASYWIHLQPEDYKTGDKYGEWLAEFPDTKFKDGTTFYQYLSKWIYKGQREIMLRGKHQNLSQKHNYLFARFEKGDPFVTARSFSAKVGQLFLSTINERVSPQKLRTIFRTYLVNKQASKAELDSAAFWMRHSPEIAQKVYTKQTLDEKLAAGSAIAQKLNSELLGLT